MKETEMIQPASAAGYGLPGKVRCLCVLVSLLLVASSLVELWIMQIDWFHDRAFQKIYQGYSEYYPELHLYPVGGKLIYSITLTLDYIGFIPYYVALILGAVIFNRFRMNIFWDKININLLKTISILIIFDACFPALKDTLQMLAFTLKGKPVFILSYGISAEETRSFIVGLSIYTFSMILSRAKIIDDENSLII
ncbi:hypothetical protein ACFSFZ_02095 [Mixta tenebrionis]|uniref:DUF2975 domain-containing protein n=1 Tax=Mixta tenebrionis TaxID=2562439 RepID=A0A506V892_9GAMM|nr:hypothetical protein [Mixta tenebrionis]TPW41907.1 hypothetical protein FKM52_11125 [Mixta tenebrionis]